MDILEIVQQFYWDTLNQESLTDSKSAKKFEHALILLDLEQEQASKVIEESEEIKNLFQVPHHLNLLATPEESENDEESSNESEDDKQSLHNIMGNTNQEDIKYKPDNPQKGQGSGTEDRKRKKPHGDFYPPSTEFKMSQSPFGSNVLFLDCKPNRKYLVDTWAKEISLIIQTNPTQYDDQETVLLLLDHKTAGTVNTFIKETYWEPVINPLTSFNNVLNGIYTMFLGIDNILSANRERDRIREESKTILNTMQICDICQLEQFYCDYEKHLFNTGDQNGYYNYIVSYLRKIPLVGTQSLARFEQEKSEVSKYSLAFAQRIVKEEIAKVCDLTRKQKQLKRFSQTCCKKLVEQRPTYGCEPQNYRKNTKKRSFKKKNVYKYKKKKKPFKPGKFFQKKSFKKKFCPKGKKNCRCWVCNEEGHYANECPNRKQHSDKIKMLEEIQLLGLDPIEDEYDGLEEVYIVEIDPGETTSESENESSDTY